MGCRTELNQININTKSKYNGKTSEPCCLATFNTYGC